MNTKDFDFVKLVFLLTSELREIARHYRALGFPDVSSSILRSLGSFDKKVEQLWKK